jgi:hypothetical protein
MTEYLHTCISAGRAYLKNGTSNVERMETITGTPLRWYVPEHEINLYREAGASDVVNGGKLMEARNAALNDADNRVVVELSDDLGTIKQKVWGQQKQEPITYLQAVETIHNEMLACDARLGGVAPTANLLYANDTPKHHHFIVGDFIVIRPTPLRFDETMILKEDYDYTCQHLHTYGIVCRVDSILAQFKHRSNPGGAVDYRTQEREQAMISHLQHKWPGVFRPNPKREGEVLMRWKPATG